MPIAIAMILPPQPLQWHAALLHRLRHAGHSVTVTPAGTARRSALDLILAFEARRFGAGLASPGMVPLSDPCGSPDLTIDLTGASPLPGASLTILFNGQPNLDATAKMVLRGGQPLLEIQRAGVTIAVARPMVSERIWLTRALNDILLRAVDLLQRCVREAPSLPALPSAPADDGTGLAAAYWLGIVPKLGHRLWLKLRYKPFHWRVGYRFHPAPPSGLGFARTASGYATATAPQWLELPEDGSRFYADPFPVEVDGRYYLFVEEFPHASAKGIIAVAECGSDGRFGPLRPVLEEPFHLSYPQVFQHDGQFWMIPETAGGRDLLLYRAERFPDRWVRHAVLLPDQPLSDATLLRQDDQFWLFAADGGPGSSSDALLVFHAPTLAGPFVPHAANPVLIDKTSARPAGAFILGGPHPVLPVQDGAAGYGSGIGLVEIVELSAATVRLGPVRPLATPGWRCAFKHTTNRAGRLEVIDGVVLQPR